MTRPLASPPRATLAAALERLRDALVDVFLLALETDDRIEALKCDCYRRIPL